MKCRNCLFFDGEKCKYKGGKYYGEKIENPDEDIECDGYIDNWIAASEAEAMF